MAPNKGQPVIGNGGFYLPQGETKSIQAPGTWSGRVWARTGCEFYSNSDSNSNWKPACETGDCQGQLECNGKIGLPPVTLVEFSLQVDERQSSFYDVSLVDGYNLPVSVSPKSPWKKCYIGGCQKNLNSVCPDELKICNQKGEVVACKSACLAFNSDKFCCRNEYRSPEKCRPSVYSKIFKDACPYFISYPFDYPAPIVNCPSDEYVITFCPYKWGSENADM
jgi:hypothetical protein